MDPASKMLGPPTLNSPLIFWHHGSFILLHQQAIPQLHCHAHSSEQLGVQTWLQVLQQSSQPAPLLPLLLLMAWRTSSWRATFHSSRVLQRKHHQGGVSSHADEHNCTERFVFDSGFPLALPVQPAEAAPGQLGSAASVEDAHNTE
jgi:hypothetical protein